MLLANVENRRVWSEETIFHLLSAIPVARDYDNISTGSIWQRLQPSGTLDEAAAPGAPPTSLPDCC